MNISFIYNQMLQPELILHSQVYNQTAPVGNQFLFDTQISQQSHPQEKQLSPWVKPHKRNSSDQAQLKQKQKFCVQYLTLNHNSFLPSRLLNKQPKIKRILLEDLKRFSQNMKTGPSNKIKQVIRNVNNINMKQIKRFNLNQSLQPDFPPKPLQPTFDRPFLQVRQKFYTRKTKRQAKSEEKTPRNGQPTQTNSQEKGTQETFYKTLELNILLKTKNKINQIKEEKQKERSRMGMTITNRTREEKQKYRQSYALDLLGEMGIRKNGQHIREKIRQLNYFSTIKTRRQSFFI